MTVQTAPFGRRLGALVVDWLCCQVIAIGILHATPGRGTAGSLVPLAVFFIENAVLVALLGSTVGHRLFGLRVGALGRPLLTPWQAIERAFLLCLFIPALIWDSSGRGLHDRLAGTVIVRR